MIGDLIINGKDAFSEWGISMSDNFIQNIMAPAPMKDYIENESRLEHGKRVLVNNPKVASRDINLTFHILGESPTDYITKLSTFFNELYGRVVNIQIPKINNQTYKLLYKKHTSFAQNYSRTSSKLVVKFEEPNPMDRG